MGPSPRRGVGAIASVVVLAGAGLAGEPPVRVTELARPVAVSAALPLGVLPTLSSTRLPTSEPAGHSALLTDPASVRGERGAAPLMIAIPRIGLAAAIVPAAAGPLGELDLPASWTEVGWYQGGPAPGEDGSSVLAAHVDFNGHAGAFFRLRELRAGDLLVVVGVDGVSRPFIVFANQQLAKASLPTAELFRSDGDPLLRLVTCGGSFDFRDHHYSDNVVVTAVPVRRAE